MFQSYFAGDKKQRHNKPQSGGRVTLPMRYFNPESNYVPEYTLNNIQSGGRVTLPMRYFNPESNYVPEYILDNNQFGGSKSKSKSKSKKCKGKTLKGVKCNNKIKKGDKYCCKHTKQQYGGIPTNAPLFDYNKFIQKC